MERGNPIGDVPAVELNDDLARAMVIDFLELANVTWRKGSVSTVAID